MTKSELLVDVLVNALETTKVGLIVKGLSDISPKDILSSLTEKISDKIYAVAVGYKCTLRDTKEYVISIQIEDAVKWRNNPIFTGKIIVFINNESDKLHSLKELDVITTRSISEQLIKVYAEKQTNTPSKNFWYALRKSLDWFSFEALFDFSQNVENETTANGTAVNPDTIPDNMWRLGLLSDKSILGIKVNPEEQLDENRQLIIAIGQISEAHRKRMSSTLAKAKTKDRDRYQTAYRNLQNFFKYGDNKVLKELEFSDVRELLIAAKTTKNDKKNTSGGGSGGSTEKVIHEKELNEIIARCIVLDFENNKDYLTELLEKVKNHFNTGDTEIDQIGGEFENRKIILDKHDTPLTKLVRQYCSQDKWGGIMETEENTLRESITGSILTNNYFQPEFTDSITNCGDITLFDLLRNFDIEFIKLKLTDITDNFSPIISDIISCRETLLDNLEIIMYFPALILKLDENLKTIMYMYIEKWTELLCVFNKNESIMYTISHNITKLVARALLLLDVLYIKTPNEYKGILLPLHPLFLWRYYEIFKTLDKGEEYNKEDAENLAKVFTNLPQVLNFLVADNYITKDNTIIELPCSGTIEMLPTFENKTNRYLGSDGVECIEETLYRWLAFAPYTQKEIRICTVDAPNIANVLKSLKPFLQKNTESKIVYTIFLTREQNGNTEIAKLEYDSKDYEIGEYIRTGRLLVNIQNVSDLKSVKEELSKRPVHIAFYFDQSSYSIEHGPSTQQLYINPLVVTYDYDYDTLTHHGEIFPSTDMESGIIGDYHKLMRTADLTSFNRIPRPTYNPDSDLKALLTNIIDKQSIWLVAADRTINNYTPVETIPIGEKRYGHRSVGIWASRNSRVIDQYLNLLSKYNLYPKREDLLDILSEFGHISSDGLISIPRNGGDKTSIENRRKGLIGTVFTAKYYSKKYSHSLVASLDTHDARLWLSKNNIADTDNRADLIGLRYDEDTNTLFIEPIEVKTRDESPDATTSVSENGVNIIEGHAADQIASVILMINEIFNITSENMFTSARKEVLKFQIVSECFRDLHDHDWQQKWDSIFKKLFGRNHSKEINVEVRGLLIHIKLGDPNSQPIKHCKHKQHIDCEIDYITLNTNDIQTFIFNSSNKSTIDWNNPDFDNSDNSQVSDVYSEVETHLNQEILPTNKQEKKTNMNPTLQNKEKINNKSQEDITSKVSKQNSTIISDEDIRKLSNDFKRSCNGYGIQIDECEPKNVIIGSSIIRFPFILSRGQRISTLRDRLEDISREMHQTGILIQTDINSDTFLDIPRKNRDLVLFSDIIKKIPEITSPEQIYFPLGRTPEGNDIFKNLKECPHLLIGGSTGSGKSVFLYTLLCTILKTHPNAEDCKILLSSSKREDFVYFEGLPQLVEGRVFSDADEMTELFKDYIYRESETRGEMLLNTRKRDIDEYNKTADKKLNPLVVIVDEFADLTDQLSNKREKEAFYTPIRKIANTGRNRGIHLVLCTQRPSADLVPSSIKSQLNGRLALRVNDAIASRMIIGEPDAQNLQKHGDMLYKKDSIIEHVQGYYITTSEVENIISEIMP